MVLPAVPMDQELLLGLVAFWEALFARGFAAEVREYTQHESMIGVCVVCLLMCRFPNRRPAHIHPFHHRTNTPQTQNQNRNQTKNRRRCAGRA